MRRFLTLVIVVPIAAVVVILSVANRGAVTFSLDPIGAGSTGWAATAPLYVFLFAAVIAGVIIGGIGAWVRQGRWRQAARAERANAVRLAAEVARLRERVEALQTTGTALSTSADRDAA
jgi:uncharacterized integral membrane protein